MASLQLQGRCIAVHALSGASQRTRGGRERWQERRWISDQSSHCRAHALVCRPAEPIRSAGQAQFTRKAGGSIAGKRECESPSWDVAHLCHLLALLVGCLDHLRGPVSGIVDARLDQALGEQQASEGGEDIGDEAKTSGGRSIVSLHSQSLAATAHFGRRSWSFMYATWVRPSRTANEVRMDMLQTHGNVSARWYLCSSLHVRPEGSLFVERHVANTLHRLENDVGEHVDARAEEDIEELMGRIVSVHNPSPASPRTWKRLLLT